MDYILVGLGNPGSEYAKKTPSVHPKHFIFMQYIVSCISSILLIISFGVAKIPLKPMYIFITPRNVIYKNIITQFTLHYK